MPLRSLTFAAAAATALLATAAPASAQAGSTLAAADLIGTYQLEVTSKTGADCADDNHLEINVLKIAGDKMEFGAEDEKETAAYNPAQNSFTFEQASSRPSETGTASGRFVREPDDVRMYLTIATGTCTGQLTGTKPAPHLAMAPDTARTLTPPPAPVPDDLKPGPFGLKGGMKGLIFWGPLGILLIVIGVVVGRMLGRPKKPDPET